MRSSAEPAADELPKQVVSWVGRMTGPDSHIQVVRRLPLGGWHLNHALTVVGGDGRVHRLVLRQWDVRAGVAMTPTTPQPGK